MKSVSVIIPSFNHAKYVLGCLQSVLDQSYPLFEVIIVDDGSSDDSVRIISNFIEKFDRPICTLIKQENAGVSSALNTGISHARGEFILVVASDDLMVSTAVEEMLRGFSSEKVGMVFGDARIIDAEGGDATTEILKGSRETKSFLEWRLSGTGVVYNHSRIDVRRVLLHHNFIPPMVMFRRTVFSSIGLFNTSLKLEDHEMWLRISRSYTIAPAREVVGKYRLHGSNTVTRANRELFRNTISILLGERKYALNSDELFLLNSRIFTLVLSYLKTYRISALKEACYYHWLRSFFKQIGSI